MRNRSGAQAAQAGLFARCIAEEMTLGLNTCASSLIQRRGSDRTTKRHRQRLERIELGQRLAGWRRPRRTGDALPRQAQRVVKQGRSLDQGGERLGAVMFSQPSLVAHFCSITWRSAVSRRRPGLRGPINAWRSESFEGVSARKNLGCVFAAVRTRVCAVESNGES